jgi:hypothetical protein
VWDLVSDSIENPENMLDDSIVFLSAYMKRHLSFIGTPSELVDKLQPFSKGKIVPNVLSKKLFQNVEKLEQMGILFNSRRANGKRIIELEYCKSSTSYAGADDSADSADKNDIPPYVQSVDPVGTVDPVIYANVNLTVS